MLESYFVMGKCQFSDKRYLSNIARIKLRRRVLFLIGNFDGIFFIMW
jgi:hypothetical protein